MRLDETVVWGALRTRARRYAAGAGLPGSGGTGCCVSCQGPRRRDRARCFHCAEHVESAPGMLADAVVPAAYAPKGSLLARDLWLYKSGCPGSRGAGAGLLGLLLVFLHDHGHEVWQRAAMSVPTHACVVPSGRGRPGTHPLRSLVAGCVALPWVPLQAHEHGGPGDRGLNPDRFRAAQPLPGARVLLLDDTWTSGASAQSAAVALKRAGALSVAVVVLGRHLTPGNRWQDAPG